MQRADWKRKCCSYLELSLKTMGKKEKNWGYPKRRILSLSDHPHCSWRVALLTVSSSMWLRSDRAGSEVKWKSLSRVRLFVTPWTLVHGFLQVRILEWVAVPFSRGSSQPRIEPRTPTLLKSSYQIKGSKPTNYEESRTQYIRTPGRWIQMSAENL